MTIYSSGCRCGESQHSVGGRCAGSTNLTNTNTVREHLLAPLRCLFAPPRLLFVCSALRCGADAMREEGHSRPGPPENLLAFGLAEVLTAICGI